MNKFKKGKGAITIIGFLFCIVCFSIYSYASEFFIPVNNASDRPDQRSALLEQERGILMEENDAYAASRGKAKRTAKDMEQGKSAAESTASPEENQLKSVPVDAPAQSAGEPAWSQSAVQPVPAPAPAPAQPSVKPAPAPAQPTAKPSPAPAPAPTKAETGSSYELDLLARLITAEAQGEPYQAKVAVGAVVINRVQSGQWAGTIKAVIYQKFDGYYQFTPVQNGWINKPAEPESVKAAKAALAGADPTNGAQFYYDDKTTNPWILAKPVSIQIGHMFFAF